MSVPLIVDLYNVRALLQERYIKISPCYGETGRRFFWIDQEITVDLSNGETITIPTTYKTDLSSVPRWLWSFASPYGDFLFAAIIHDWLYSNNIESRYFADKEMLLWSVAINDNQTDNYLRYKAVRWFGRSWWEKAAKRIAATVI